MPRRQKRPETSLAELRKRHEHCITLAQIYKDIQQGRVPSALVEKWRAKNQLHSICSFPEEICAAPDISEASLAQAIEDARKERESDQEGS